MSATPRARTDPVARFGVGRALPATRPATLATILLTLVLVAILGGCTLVDAGRSGVSSASGSTGESRTETDPETRVQLQAREALDRWEAAVEASGGASITFVGELTSHIGSWDGDDGKAALDAGAVEAGVTLSNVPPAKAEVKWLDGTKVDVDVLSAAAALEELVAAASGACDGCRKLVVTDANLATELVETSDGPAEAPVWVFTLDGSDVRLTRVAVDDSVTVNPPPWNAENPPIGVSIDGANVHPDDKKLTVSFAGAAEGADKPCGADYTAETLESELAVVVIVVADPNPAANACPLIGAYRTATVTLVKALGKRAVLEVRQGLPVPVTATAR